MKNSTILKLAEVNIKDVELVGGKNASLGEMIQNLAALGIQVPDGFIITVKAYRDFLTYNKLNDLIEDILNSLEPDNLLSLQKCGKAIRSLITDAEFSPHLKRQIDAAYSSMSISYGQHNVDVAVRSSATAEDLPDASFAGQQETYLNVSGLASIYDAVRKCFASLFTDRAISYRHGMGYEHSNIGLSVCVQKMVRSDKGASGVAFSLDPESGFKDVVVINGSFGLGEMVVQGAVSPDEFIVFKPALIKGQDAIIDKKLGEKNSKMVYGTSEGERVKTVDCTNEEQTTFCLNNQQILQLASWVLNIEKHYSEVKGEYCPMDIEWAVDGLSGELYIVQARPETIHSRKKHNTIKTYTIHDAGRASKVILQGIAVGDKIASGKVRVFKGDAREQITSAVFERGDVLVADMTDPDWEPIMKKASAIITNKGGRTCHAAIVARELGVPAIVGCGNATEVLKESQEVTASCAEGTTGLVYDGEIDYKIHEIDLDNLPDTRTPVLMNVASADLAFTFASYPSKGVGLAREEFIINNFIQAHPLALLKYKELNDDKLTERIERLTNGYKDGAEYFIEKLSFGVAKIAAAFYPNNVIVRFSDFKSNEYYNLLGGEHFEPHEENPMIGWRGASRYYSPEYKEAFGLECLAIKRVREEMGFENVVVMIPFCRTVYELFQVYETMDEYGLRRGENGLQVYLMAELPSNIIMAAEFAKYIDGFSIGSNDLTQLVLGLDRDSSLVAHIYDERNYAVKKMIRMLITTAREAGINVGICGQGPSDFPDFAQFLVEEGIDSISVTPDSFLKTVNAIHQIESQEEIIRKDYESLEIARLRFLEEKYRNAG